MSCSNVTLLVEKSKITPLSVKEIVSLKIHLALCPPCSDYSKLSQQFDELLQTEENEKLDELTLSDEKKQAILDLLSNYDK